MKKYLTFEQFQNQYFLCKEVALFRNEFSYVLNQFLTPPQANSAMRELRLLLRNLEKEKYTKVASLQKKLDKMSIGQQIAFLATSNEELLRLYGDHLISFADEE
jgi:hypothetical protein